MIAKVDIENSGGSVLGPGPIITARNVQVTAALDRAGSASFSMPAADPRAALLQDTDDPLAKRIARIRALIGGAQTELGSEIIDSIQVQLDAAGAALTVQGDDILRELTNNLVDGLELSELAWLTPDAAQEVENNGGETDLTNAIDGDAGTGSTLTLIVSPRRYLYVGHAVQFDKVRLNLGSPVNNNAATLSAQYFNGTGWASVAISDGTASGGATLAIDGDLTWTMPSDQTQVRHDNQVLYWVRFTPSADLDAVDVREIEIWTKTGTLDCLAPIMALAPAGWSLNTVDWYDETLSPVYFTFGDNTTVLAALVKIAELTGEHFRLGTGRQVEWLQNDQPASGLRAVEAGSPLVAANDQVCLITALERMTDTYGVVTRVYPYGGGLGPARVTLADCTETAPAGFTLDTANNFIAIVPPPPVLVEDSFTDDDGTRLDTHVPDVSPAGATWSIAEGTAAEVIISGNRAKLPKTVPTDQIYVPLYDAGYAPVQIDVEVTFTASAFRGAGVIIRAIDEDNHWIAWLDIAVGSFDLYKVVAGVSTLMDSVAFAFAIDTPYAVRIWDEGGAAGVFATVDGGSEISSADATHSTETLFGLRSYSAVGGEVAECDGLVVSGLDVTPSYISRAVTFPEVRSVDGSATGDVQAANQLFRAAQAWLEKRCARAQFYRVTVTKLAQLLRPGETIRVICRRLVGSYVELDIDEELLILRVQHQLDEQGLYTAGLELASVDRYPETDASVLVRASEPGTVAQTRFNQIDGAALEAALQTSAVLEHALFRRGGAKPAVSGDVTTPAAAESLAEAFAALGLATNSTTNSPPAVTGAHGTNAALINLLSVLDTQGIIDDQTT